MSEKYNAALGAYELISKNDGPLVLGIGTGSTTDFFTKEFLPILNKQLKCIYSSSDRTTNLLNRLGFKVKPYEPNIIIDIYVDGADEVDRNLNLIKGGGGAHTNEKRLAKVSNNFICIVDELKIVETLGNFPLPIEIDINQKEEALSELKKYSKTITLRDTLSENQNYLFDIHNFKISDPYMLENDILSIKGVIDVGIFSVDKPQIVVVGKESSYRLIES
tara:strand:+ start:497 stop:1156 length:660 start_codon:yes stop_codon:yes gene_type:complete